MNRLIIFLVTVSICLPCVSMAESNASQEAFERTLKRQLPMNKKQLQKFKQRMDDTKRTLQDDKPPEMTSRTRELRFETGGEPPVVRIAPGYVTTISFCDSTGQPWPIESAVLGNPNYYNLERPEGGKGNIITVSALKKYTDSNVVLTFKGKNMPATVQLKTVSGGDATDSLVVFKSNERGPEAKQPSIGPKVQDTVSNTMLSFLDSTPPESAKPVEIEPVISGVNLWSYKDMYYLRTTHPLLWPAWNAITKGANGVRVYEMPSVPSLILSREGESISVSVKSKI